MKQFKSVLMALLANSSFALASGALIYLMNEPLTGFTRMGTSLFVAGIVFVAMPINILGIALLDEFLTRRDRASA